MTKPTQTAPEVTEVQPRRDATALRQRREALDCSRKALAELTGLSVSRIWASEQEDKELSDEHLQIITATLDNIEANGLPAHLQPKRAANPRDTRLSQIAAILDEALRAKTAKDMRAHVERAKAVLVGDGNEGAATTDADDDAPLS